MENRLYVGNLPYSATEDELRSLFEQAGTVVSVVVIKDRDSGRSKGFAFVEMSTGQEALQAVQLLSGQAMGGRELRVSLARSREESPRRDYGRDRNAFGLGGDSTTDAPPPKKK